MAISKTALAVSAAVSVMGTMGLAHASVVGTYATVLSSKSSVSKATVAGTGQLVDNGGSPDSSTFTFTGTGPGVVLGSPATVGFDNTLTGALVGGVFTPTGGTDHLVSCTGSSNCGLGLAAGANSYSSVTGSFSETGGGLVTGIYTADSGAVTVTDIYNVTGNPASTSSGGTSSGGTSSGGSTVPLPPAVWLLGSGLLGLVGTARRRSVKAK